MQISILPSNDAFHGLIPVRRSLVLLLHSAILCFRAFFSRSPLHTCINRTEQGSTYCARILRGTLIYQIYIIIVIRDGCLIGPLCWRKMLSTLFNTSTITSHLAVFLQLFSIERKYCPHPQQRRRRRATCWHADTPNNVLLPQGDTFVVLLVMSLLLHTFFLLFTMFSAAVRPHQQAKTGRVQLPRHWMQLRTLFIRRTKRGEGGRGRGADPIKDIGTLVLMSPHCWNG